MFSDLSPISKKMYPLLFLMLILLIWQKTVTILNISEIILPTPLTILTTYFSMTFKGRLFYHSWITILETLIGFTGGVLIGSMLGYFCAKSKIAELVLSPFIIGAHTTPKMALAPIFLIWFGFGLLSKILITSLVVFFPIFINVILAIKSINPDLKDLMKINHANSWQIFKELELPSALPILFAGLKSGITLAIVGSVVAEFIGAKAGLGYLIILNLGNLDTPAVFASMLQLIFIGIIFYTILSFIASILMPWHESEKYYV